MKIKTENPVRFLICFFMTSRENQEYDIRSMGWDKLIKRVQSFIITYFMRWGMPDLSTIIVKTLLH